MYLSIVFSPVFIKPAHLQESPVIHPAFEIRETPGIRIEFPLFVMERQVRPDAAIEVDLLPVVFGGGQDELVVIQVTGVEVDFSIKTSRRLAASGRFLFPIV